MSITIKYPGKQAGKTSSYICDQTVSLSNEILECSWAVKESRLYSLHFSNKHNNQNISFETGFMPKIILENGDCLDLSELTISKDITLENNTIQTTFSDKNSGLTIEWSAKLDDESNAIIQKIKTHAAKDTAVSELVFMSTHLDDAKQVGKVDGSVIVCGNIFIAIEHPLANNIISSNKELICSLPQKRVLRTKESWSHTFAMGVVPKGQLRRGFLYYIEQRRAHPYRPYLHYNNWYDVFLGRKEERITEPECLETIEYFGRELVEKRNVKMDAMVWDDGWDDFNTLWDFHKGFPNGFKTLNQASKKYGIEQGVWMSPNGGYASAKDKRIAYGKPLGYETNSNGYSMGGANYAKAFHKVCLNMIRENHVNFFKFDGMGQGGEPTGAGEEFSDDISAILELSKDLHKEKPDVYISATAGTWPSPFWLMTTDSIWRQGGDSGHEGKGDSRQTWLNFRDIKCYERIVQMGPLYPLNSLMLHGILIGDREGRAPAGMVLNEKSVADEIWTFFGSGTCLQELYISPGVMSEIMLDTLAEAANWSRANSKTLIDSHWIGGSPRAEEVYGWASWQEGKGIIVLRNPSEKSQSYSITLNDALEYPHDLETQFELKSIYPKNRELNRSTLSNNGEFKITLEAFETIVLELIS